MRRLRPGHRSLTPAATPSPPGPPQRQGLRDGREFANPNIPDMRYDEEVADGAAFEDGAVDTPRGEASGAPTAGGTATPAARWKKSQRRAVVATAVALVGGGLTFASMDRHSRAAQRGRGTRRGAWRPRTGAEPPAVRPCRHTAVRAPLAVARHRLPRHGSATPGAPPRRRTPPGLVSVARTALTTRTAQTAAQQLPVTTPLRRAGHRSRPGRPAPSQTAAPAPSAARTRERRSRPPRRRPPRLAHLCSCSPGLTRTTPRPHRAGAHHRSDHRDAGPGKNPRPASGVPPSLHPGELHRPGRRQPFAIRRPRRDRRGVPRHPARRRRHGKGTCSAGRTSRNNGLQHVPRCILRIRGGPCPRSPRRGAAPRPAASESMKSADIGHRCRLAGSCGRIARLTHDKGDGDRVAGLPVGGPAAHPTITRPGGVVAAAFRSSHGISSHGMRESTGADRGRYQLDTTIGRGAMGEVWRAYDQMLGRPVAVRSCSPERAIPPRTPVSAWRPRPRDACTTPVSASSTSGSTRTGCSW